MNNNIEKSDQGQVQPSVDQTETRGKVEDRFKFGEEDAGKIIEAAIGKKSKVNEPKRKRLDDLRMLKKTAEGKRDKKNSERFENEIRKIENDFLNEAIDKKREKRGEERKEDSTSKILEKLDEIYAEKVEQIKKGGFDPDAPRVELGFALSFKDAQQKKINKKIENKVRKLDKELRNKWEESKTEMIKNALKEDGDDFVKFCQNNIEWEKECDRFLGQQSEAYLKWELSRIRDRFSEIFGKNRKKYGANYFLQKKSLVEKRLKEMKSDPKRADLKINPKDILLKTTTEDKFTPEVKRHFKEEDKIRYPYAGYGRKGDRDGAGDEIPMYHQPEIEGEIPDLENETLPEPGSIEKGDGDEIRKIILMAGNNELLRKAGSALLEVDRLLRADSSKSNHDSEEKIIEKADTAIKECKNVLTEIKTIGEEKQAYLLKAIKKMEEAQIEAIKKNIRNSA